MRVYELEKAKQNGIKSPHFFYNGPFSQWYPSDIVVDTLSEPMYFNCAEQLMMFNKACCFRDFEVAEKIMNEKHPRDQKALGRTVRDYTDTLWFFEAFDDVLFANYLKFTQNKKLQEEFDRTKECDLYVEASPTDHVWGIGLAENNERILDPANWRGTNLLGEVISSVRDLVNGKNIGLLSSNLECGGTMTLNNIRNYRNRRETNDK